MRVIERTIEHPEDEGVILEYVKLTKDFAEIKEYVKRKGDTITGYTQRGDSVSIRIEDILYYETVDGSGRPFWSPHTSLESVDDTVCLWGQR